MAVCALLSAFAVPLPESHDGPRRFTFLSESSGLIAGCGSAVTPTLADSGQCNGHGACIRDGTYTSQGTCACNAPWKGRYCDYIECPSYGLAECAGRGRCQLDGAQATCACDAGYAGVDCAIVLGCDPWSSGLPCQGRGNCLPSSRCSCDVGYGGERCEQDLLCPTDAMGRPCGGSGVCVAHVCVCKEQFFGLTCEEVDTSTVERPEPPSISDSAIMARHEQGDERAAVRPNAREPLRFPRHTWTAPARSAPEAAAVTPLATRRRLHEVWGAAGASAGESLHEGGAGDGRHVDGVERSRSGMPAPDG